MSILPTKKYNLVLAIIFFHLNSIFLELTRKIDSYTAKNIMRKYEQVQEEFLSADTEHEHKQ